MAGVTGGPRSSAAEAGSAPSQAAGEDGGGNAMWTATRDGRRLSRLMLGTVQFGLRYGIANRTGQPSYREVRAIVETALAGGVNGFDTAAAYGTSEEVLGRALRELGVAEDVLVVTKVRPLSASEVASAAAASRAIEQSVAGSRRRLQLDCLPCVLFHRESDAVYLDVLGRLQQRGWLRQLGVSCDNQPGPAAEFLRTGCVGALQVPGSVVDRRHQRSGIFAEAAARGVAVFLRSVYLQGLLLMPEDVIPAALQGILPVRRRLAAVAAEAGLSLAELAARYMLSQEGITCVLAGVETAAQVRENLAIFARGPLAPDLRAAIDAAVPDLPATLLTPRMWEHA
jgi:aryl-alcohol dehydrogenase-like predicted oxidoreductase